MNHILLTGRPGTGKTTLLKKIIEVLDLPCGGFYTEEMKEYGQRAGFKIKTLDGEEGVLARKGLKSKIRLGGYGINLKDLDEIGVGAVDEAIKSKEIVVIDEIGKMELFSEKFKSAVEKALDSGKRVVGVIHIADLGFLNNIRKRKDVLMLEVGLENHDEVLRKVKEILKSD